MKKLSILAVMAALCMSLEVKAWGTIGHTAVAFLAENHLTPAAKENIAKFTEGKSIAYWASWMDFNRTLEEYKHTNNWHVDYWTEDEMKDPEGNPLPPQNLTQLKRIISQMQDFRSLKEEDVILNIKYIVHLVGDMHCPTHVDFPVNRKMKVKLNGKIEKYHKMWDQLIIQRGHENWGALLISEYLDTSDEQKVKALMAGTPDDWYAQTIEASEQGYKLLPKDNVITDQNYIEPALVIADRQLQRAGMRLARVLNEIFDK